MRAQESFEQKPVGPSEIGKNLFIHASGKFPDSDIHQAAYIAIVSRQYSSYLLETLRDALLADRSKIKYITRIANSVHEKKHARLGNPPIYNWNTKFMVRRDFYLARRMYNVPDEELINFLKSYKRGDKDSYRSEAIRINGLIEKWDPDNKKHFRFMRVKA